MWMTLRLLSPRLLGLLNRWRRAGRGERLTIASLVAFGLVFWAALFALMIALVGAFYKVEVLGPIVSRTLLELMISGLFVLLCFSNVVSSLSTFYLSEDLELVLSFPITRPTFHFARLVDSTVQSSWMLGFFGLPVIVAYGLAYDAGWPFVLALAAALPGYLLIPGSFGLLVASTLVRVFPARKLREALAIFGLFTLAALFMLLRLVRPERILEADSVESVAAYVANLQDPVPLLFPARWASDVLVAALMGRPFPWIELGLLVTGGIAAEGVARWLTDRVYDEGRARSQEARAARLARAGWLDRLLALWTWPLEPVARAIVIKDVKSFVRDPSQWTQVFLVGSIVVITLSSVAFLPDGVVRGRYAYFWDNFIAFAAHSLVGFIMSAVAARFQFTAVSLEGRAFWFVRTAPMRPTTLLWAKVWPWLPLMLLLGQLLAIPSMVILGAGPFLVCLSSATAIALAPAISGIAVGIGAMYPDFKAENAARVAASPTAMLFMVSALVLVFLVVALEAVPAWLVVRASFEDRGLRPLEWVGVALPLLLALGACAAATFWPIRRGAASLWARELPNS
jgi:ABC-2 type transport system permease protein